ncbi:hypothetical protein MTO96_000290 [Rhipicephalus appendiculatus]
MLPASKVDVDCRELQEPSGSREDVTGASPLCEYSGAQHSSPSMVGPGEKSAPVAAAGDPNPTVSAVFRGGWVVTPRLHAPFTSVSALLKKRRRLGSPGGTLRPPDAPDTARDPRTRCCSLR